MASFRNKDPFTADKGKKKKKGIGGFRNENSSSASRHILSRITPAVRISKRAKHSKSASQQNA